MFQSVLRDFTKLNDFEKRVRNDGGSYPYTYSSECADYGTGDGQRRQA